MDGDDRRFSRRSADHPTRFVNVQLVGGGGRRIRHWCDRARSRDPPRRCVSPATFDHDVLGRHRHGLESPILGARRVVLAATRTVAGLVGGRRVFPLRPDLHHCRRSVRRYLGRIAVSLFNHRIRDHFRHRGVRTYSRWMDDAGNSDRLQRGPLYVLSRAGAAAVGGRCRILPPDGRSDRTTSRRCSRRP